MAPSEQIRNDERVLLVPRELAPGVRLYQLAAYEGKLHPPGLVWNMQNAQQARKSVGKWVVAEGPDHVSDLALLRNGSELAAWHGPARRYLFDSPEEAEEAYAKFCLTRGG